MKGKPRLVLISLGVLAALCIGGAVLVSVFVNPNDYKPQIQALVLKATGRQLVMSGDLSLSLFPFIRIKAGPAELGDDPSFGPEPFLRVENIRAGVGLFPLLRGRVEIGTVTISGARLKLAVNKDGRANWTTAPAGKEKPGAASPAGSAPGGGAGEPDLTAVALESLNIADSQVRYVDMRSGQNAQFTIAALSLGPVRVGKKAVLDLEGVCAGALARPVPVTLNATFVLPATLSEGSGLSLSGRADATEFSFTGNASLSSAGERPELALSGELNVGDLDLDKYTVRTPARNAPKTPEQAAPPVAEQAGPGGEAVRDLLQSLFLDLRIQMNSITVAKVPVTDIRATMKNYQGLFVAKPVSMNVADGPLTLEATADASRKTARLRSVGKWREAKLQSLLRALTGRESAAGNLNADWNVTGTGLDWSVLSRGIAGTASVFLEDGKIPAFALIPAGLPGLPSFITDIEQLRGSATWEITDGLAKNNDLTMKAVNMTAQGGGQINIPDRTMDYRLVVDLPPLKGLPGLDSLPVVISGPLSAPRYRVDETALLRDTAKNVIGTGGKVGKEVQKGVGKALDKLLR